MIIRDAIITRASSKLRLWIPRTGDYGEQRIEHIEGAEKFYRDLAAQGKKVRVGMEASGQARWFERLLAELNFELWIGDATEIARKRERKQKTDRQDALHILQLLIENRFPKIWVPSGENRDLRQLHRHRMVQMRTRIMNQLQVVALNEGLRCKKRLWREHGRAQLESFRLAPWASRRREDLLQLLDRLNPTIADLTQRIVQEEFEVVIMIEVMTEEMHGSDRDSDLQLITSESCWYGHLFLRERNGAHL
jgi:transposase